MPATDGDPGSPSLAWKFFTLASVLDFGQGGDCASYVKTLSNKLDFPSMLLRNSTGILSPYGSFFATEPGEAALVTMPDIDTGARGTCIVHCVSLQLDKNHDGIMDSNFNGADTTSPDSSMVCWVNNDCDWSYYVGDVGKDIPSTPKTCDYLNQNIISQRDLEDWFRLWICGVPA